MTFGCSNGCSLCFQAKIKKKRREGLFKSRSKSLPLVEFLISKEKQEEHRAFYLSGSGYRPHVQKAFSDFTEGRKTKSQDL